MFFHRVLDRFLMVFGQLLAPFWPPFLMIFRYIFRHRFMNDFLMFFFIEKLIFLMIFGVDFFMFFLAPVLRNEKAAFRFRTRKTMVFYDFYRSEGPGDHQKFTLRTYFFPLGGEVSFNVVF